MKGFEGIAKKSENNKKNRLSALVAGALLFSASEGLADSDRNFETYTTEALEKTPHVRAIKSEDGEILFFHNDEETTEIINFLAGIGPLTEDHVAAAMRKEFFITIKKAGEDVTSSEIRDYIYSIDTREEIRDFYKKYWSVFTEGKNKFGDDPVGYADSRFNEFKQSDEEVRAEINPELYEVLWTLFIHAGAPRIEWVDTAIERRKSKDSEYAGSNYYVFNNGKGESVLYIDRSYKSDRALAALIDELAHAYSFHKDPQNFYEGRNEIHEFLKNNDISNPEVRQEINKFYLEPGNEEYYAHQVLFPKLMDIVSKYHPTMSTYKEKYKENYRLIRENLKKLQNE